MTSGSLLGCPSADDARTDNMRAFVARFSSASDLFGGSGPVSHKVADDICSLFLRFPGS